MNLTSYERRQVTEIREWKAEEPSVISMALGIALSPVTWLMNKLVPLAAIRGALDLSSSAAEWLTDTDDLVRDAGVQTLEDLKTLSLEKSDDLANSVHNWAIALATAEGGTTGTLGLPGVAVDIPAIITFALRTIHKIGACYGYEIKSRSDRDFVFAILSSASANDMEEKTLALLALRSIEVTLMKHTWKAIAQQAGTQTVGTGTAILAIKSLAAQLGVNLTKRKILQAIPVIGAMVGASVNGWYLKEIGWAAPRAYQERWLAENGKLDGPIDS